MQEMSKAMLLCYRKGNVHIFSWWVEKYSYVIIQVHARNAKRPILFIRKAVQCKRLARGHPHGALASHDAFVICRAPVSNSRAMSSVSTSLSLPWHFLFQLYKASIAFEDFSSKYSCGAF